MASSPLCGIFGVLTTILTTTVEPWSGPLSTKGSFHPGGGFFLHRVRGLHVRIHGHSDLSVPRTSMMTRG
jgi:hypothetical protein